MALCLIVKDEPAPFLKEWLEYHLLAGVEHFIVYDHQSRVPVAESLAPYVAGGLAEVETVQGDFPQLGAYAHCLAAHGGSFRWIGFLDADEFLVSKRADDFRLVLERFESHAALGVNWTMFGSSGHIERPRGLQIEHFTQALPEDTPANRHIKTFLDPSRTIRPLSPHHFQYRDGCCCVNEKRLPVHGPRCPRSVELAQINHYYFRSRQDFEEKSRRGFAQDVPGRGGYAMAEFDRQQAMPTHKDLSAQRNLARLKAMLRKGDGAMALGFRKERDVGPDEAVHRGLALAGRRRNDEAETLLRLAALRFPELAIPKLALAGTLRTFGRPAEGLEFARRALELDATPEAWIELAHCLLAMGDKAGARETAAFVREEMIREESLDEDWERRLNALG